MGLFKKTRETPPLPDFPEAEYEPVIRCSICTGEQVSCMRSRSTGKLHEVMFLRSPEDLDEFCRQYGVDPAQVRKVY